MATKIKVSEQADIDAVMGIIERTATDLRYRFERHDSRTATAHEGGKEVKGNVAATRVRVGVEVEPGTVRLKSETTGAAWAGAAGNPFFTTRINWRFAKFVKAVKRAAQDAGVA